MTPILKLSTTNKIKKIGGRIHKFLLDLYKCFFIRMSLEIVLKLTLKNIYT